MRPLLYLDYRQAVNTIRHTLHSPKRLIPILVGGFFILFQFLQPLLMMWLAGPGFYRRQAAHRMHTDPDAVWALLFVAGMLYSLNLIYKSFSESMIVYGLAEIDFVFPTPISSRIVTSYHLLKTYLKTALVFVFIFALSTPAFTSFAGIDSLPLIPLSAAGVVLFAVLLINVSVIVNSAFALYPERASLPRRIVRALAIGLVIAFAFAIVVVYLRSGDLAESALVVFRQPVLSTLMLPIAWAATLASSPFAGYQSGCVTCLAGLASLAFASFLYVVLRVKQHYEPSIDVSIRAATRMAAMRSGGMLKLRAEVMKERRKVRPVLSVPIFGRGAGAVIWEEVVKMVRGLGRGVILVPVLLPVAAVVAHSLVPRKMSSQGLVALSASFLMYIIWAVTLFMLQGMRNSLKQYDLLKPLPLATWKIMVAQTIPGGILVTLLVWVLSVSVLLFFGSAPDKGMTLIILGLPFVAYGAICSQVVVAVLYPNWNDVSQQWIGTLISGALELAAIAPPMAVGGILFYIGANPAIILPVVAALSLALAFLGILLGTLAYAKRDPILD